MADGLKGHASIVLTAVRAVSPTGKIEGSCITVNETISKFSFLYERVRNAVDYKDEHLIRKAAILRILKRQLMLETDPQIIATHLVRELIGARYLMNGVLPESVIDFVAVCIRKLQAVSRVRAGSERHIAWLQGIVSVEIEEILVDAAAEKALVTFLYERLAESVRVRGAELEETERRLQIYVACYRSLVKADDEMLDFKLLRAYLPEWLRPDDWLADARSIAERLVAIERRVTERLRHPLSLRFLQAVKPWAVSLAILRDVVREAGDAAAPLLAKENDLGARVVQKTEERYKSVKAKLRRGTMRAMLYLFITKMIFALLLEIPIEFYWYKELSYLSLGINLLFPPVLMFIVGLMIRLPGRDNTDKIRQNACDLLSDAPLGLRELRVSAGRRGLTKFFFTLAYAATFFLTFGLVGLGLKALDFTWVSSLIFIFFLCIVSFFAFRLRLGAREVVVVERKQGLIAFFIDFLSLPILRAGRWLSHSISRLNVFLFFFDFLFEAPFKMFLTVLEEWFAFLKEKKEELQ